MKRKAKESRPGRNSNNGKDAVFGLLLRFDKGITSQIIKRKVIYHRELLVIIID